jgi:hypothetical protein
MPEPLVDLRAIAALVGGGLARVIDETDFDVLLDEASGILVVGTDDWTLNVEAGDAAMAFLAIDDEPDDPARLPEVLEAVLGNDVIAALARADAALEGELSQLLQVTGDPLSAALARALESQSGDEASQ